MKRREKEILYFLAKNTRYITGVELADQFSVTSRTIRDDINSIKKELNDDIAIINSQAGKGYLLDIKNFKFFEEFLSDLKLKDVSQYYDVPDNPYDRVSYIIKKLLMLDFSIRIDDLAEELYISRSTLTSELKQVRARLNKYDLHLSHQSGKGLIIEGEELKKRLCISEYYFHNPAIDGYFVEDSALFASSVNQEEIAFIKNLLLNTLNQSKIFMSDTSFQNLVIHLIISIRRMRYSYYVEYKQENINQFKKMNEYRIAESIAVALGKEFNEIWNESEICYLTSHILAKKMILSDEGEKKVSKQVEFLIEKIIFDIYMEAGIDLGSDDYFKNVLKLHLNPLILRLQSGLISRNMMLDDIKTNYPFAYELALIAKKVIQDEMNVSVIEDECGYIALYIGLAIEKMVGEVQKKNILIVSSLGRSAIEIQKFKIINQFSEYINRLDVVELYELPNIQHDIYDVVLSSVPITYKIHVPIQYIHSILTSTDLEQIKNKLTQKFQDTYSTKNLFQNIWVSYKPVTSWSEIPESISKSNIDNESSREVINLLKFNNFKITVKNDIALVFTISPQKTDSIYYITAQSKFTYEKNVFKSVIIITHSLSELSTYQQVLQSILSMITNKESAKLLCEMDQAKVKDFITTYLGHTQ
ncbi:lichenan operon transcriptional antiterminator [Breznakia blatticola]|uniref:Lichenan operon transcriptional antiterminator n=1 Tax=Breznakia blatticola TaxID=1754012 RepID=A0A4R7ZGS2_9FIRM|nr:transcription antiterminator [Breznakia blatticola]TDW16375.1 lichenan operon transcriptional antiterminator [Breznakia blatticola]